MTPIADQIRQWHDKRSLPICQKAASAFEPYFDQMGTAEVLMAMLPIQMAFMLANGKRPSSAAVNSAIRLANAQSGIPVSVLRLHADCLFAQQKEAKPALTSATNRARDTA